MFVERRTCWKLTWPGRLLVLFASIVIVAASGRILCDFLAVTAPVEAGYLVVEAWMPPYAFREAVRQFEKGTYEKIIVVGKNGLDETSGCAIDKDLIRFGAPSDRVVIANGERSNRDRTFHSALDARAWLLQEGVRSASLDIMSLGPHARRSRLLFEKAFGEESRVGVIAVTDRRFEQEHWWRSSAGFRIVTGEAIAYMYARFLPWTPD